MTQVFGVTSARRYESIRFGSPTVVGIPSSASRRASGRLSTRNSISNPAASTRCSSRMTSSSWQTASARTINDYIGECRGSPGSRTRHWSRGPCGRRHGIGPPVRASVDLVSLPVVVTSRGQPVLGLTADDFDIREGGVRQNIVAFADALSDTVPIQLGLMLDKSLSMERDLGGGVQRRDPVRQRFPGSTRRDVRRVRAHRAPRPLPAAQLPAALRAHAGSQDRMGHGALRRARTVRREHARPDRHPRARDVHRRRRLDERPRRARRSSSCCAAGG